MNLGTFLNHVLKTQAAYFPPDKFSTLPFLCRPFLTWVFTVAGGDQAVVVIVTLVILVREEAMVSGIGIS